MAHRPSTIDKLPQAIRDEIQKLRGAGYSIDEVLAALRELHSAEISRSALGRHFKHMEDAGREMRQSRQIAEMLVRQLGDEPESRIVQANIQLMHSTLMRLFVGDSDAVKEIKENPQALMMLSKALDHLTRSSKTDADFIAKVEARVEARIRAENEERLKAVVKEKGLTAETAKMIRARVLGQKQ